MPANTSYLFYKEYYANRPVDKLKLEWEDVGNEKNKSNKQFFSSKNKAIFNQTIVPVITISSTTGGNKDLSVLLKTVYPGLLYGSGLSHETGAVGELKIGFQLDFTTGMPVLMGSGVKGVLRSYFPNFTSARNNALIPDLTTGTGKLTDEELKKKREELTLKINLALYIAKLLKFIPQQDYDNYLNNSAEPKVEEICREIHLLELNLFEGVNLEKSNLENGEVVYNSIYKRDIFHEAVPVESASSKVFGIDAITPHVKDNMPYEKAMTKSPIPLPFLKILPGVVYKFQFDFKMTVVLNKEITANQKVSLAKELILTFGIGAKTNVGYGRFVSNRLVAEQTNIIDQITEASAKARELMNANSEWEGKIVFQKKENFIIEFRVGDEAIRLKKKTDKFNGINPPILGALVKIKFTAKYTFASPSFEATVL